MNFGNLGFMEIMILLVLVLLLFGAKRLPEIGASMGKGIKEFKKSISDVDRSLTEAPRDTRDRLTPPPAERDAVPRDDDTQPGPKRLI